MKKIYLKYIATTLAFLLFLLINIPYETSMPYNDTEIYIAEEPYTDINLYNYTFVEPYNEYIPIDYVVLDAQYENSVSNTPSFAWVSIKNNDTIGGNFRVDFQITTKDGTIPLISKISSTGYYISPGETQTIKVSSNETIRDLKYDIIPPKKELTKYRNVTAQKTETKFRKVQRSREVIKFKIERKSLLQRIILP